AACAAACTGQDASERTPDGWPAEVGQCLDRAIVNGRCDVAAARDCFVPASCDNQDDIQLLPVNGGRFDVNTAGRPDAYDAGCGGEGPEAVLALPVRANATVTVEVVQADYDTLIFARRDDCDDPGREVACNDDFNGLNSRIQFQAEPGLYYLYIDGFGGDSGRSTITVAVQPR
ncbi:MAG: hypothetical protein KC549_17435, partial [Myxococcales bacterium]|nr:hypothetical protein [Myxococcales bacterium]